MALKTTPFRPLGSNELYARNCHKKHQGAMNILCGLTLVTRHQIDEGNSNLKGSKVSQKCFTALIGSEVSQRPFMSICLQD